MTAEMNPQNHPTPVLSQNQPGLVPTNAYSAGAKARQSRRPARRASELTVGSDSSGLQLFQGAPVPGPKPTGSMAYNGYIRQSATSISNISTYKYEYIRLSGK